MNVKQWIRQAFVGMWIFMLFCAMPWTVCAKTDIAAVTADVAQYLAENTPNPTIGAVGGDWTILGLMRYDRIQYADLAAQYQKNARQYILERGGVLHEKKYTEYARAALALTAAGADAQNVEGYNLLLPLTEEEKTMQQGFNGAVWALLALNARENPKMPEAAAACRNYAEKILSMQHTDGGWGLGEESDIDMTAMALSALAGFRTENTAADAINRALAYLSDRQNADGSFGSFAESTAQVVTAMAALGIAADDPRFVKGEKTATDGLCNFYLGGGCFAHQRSGAADRMATEQCFYALVAWQRFLKSESALFDMRDVYIAEGASETEKGLPSRDPAVRPREIGAAKTFSDILGHPYQREIEDLAARAIISGMDENTFSPDATMTRAEFATIMVKGLGLAAAPGKEFADVPSDAWYAGYIATAEHFNIVTGVSEQSFLPDGQITREEAAVMVCRAAKLCGADRAYDETARQDILSVFDDYKTISAWAEEAAAFCCDTGILPDTGMQIEPQIPVLRAEVAHMLYQLLRCAALL